MKEESNITKKEIKLKRKKEQKKNTLENIKERK